MNEDIGKTLNRNCRLDVVNPKTIHCYIGQANVSLMWIQQT